MANPGPLYKGPIRYPKSNNNRPKTQVTTNMGISLIKSPSKYSDNIRVLKKCSDSCSIVLARMRPKMMVSPWWAGSMGFQALTDLSFITFSMLAKRTDTVNPCHFRV